MVHVGNTLTEGHYRAALYDDARILYTDDNKVATVATRNNLKEISSNAYVLYLTRVRSISVQCCATVHGHCHHTKPCVNILHFHLLLRVGGFWPHPVLYTVARRACLL